MRPRPKLKQLLEQLRGRYGLSRRETEVVGAGTFGYCTKETAVVMACSAKTVDELWRRVYKKIRCDSRLAVMARLLAIALDEEEPAGDRAVPPISSEVAHRRTPLDGP
jgi:DNA-binding CsgD family transcriptional regulator